MEHNGPRSHSDRLLLSATRYRCFGNQHYLPHKEDYSTEWNAIKIEELSIVEFVNGTQRLQVPEREDRANEG